MTRLSRDAYGLQVAAAVAGRADCTRRQVGAVIIAPDGSIIATGYNGLAAGRPGCASAGACPRGQMAYPTEAPHKVGESDFTPSYEEGPWCSTTDATDEFSCTLSKGHDGDWHVAGDGARVVCVWPVVVTQPAAVGYDATGCRAVHAEVNAIIRAGRDRCVGATIYVTDEPCFGCSVVIEGAGLARVVTPATIPTFATGGWIREELHAASERAAALPAYARPTVTRPVSNVGPRTSGPLDPEILPASAPAPGGMDPVAYAALRRSVLRQQAAERKQAIAEREAARDHQ